MDKMIFLFSTGFLFLAFPSTGQMQEKTSIYPADSAKLLSDPKLFFSDQESDFSSLWEGATLPQETSFEAKFFHMLFILALLIAFMFVASWALKRMMRSKTTQLNTASQIKLIESRCLSPRATLHLVEVDEKRVLISESPTAVGLIAILSSSSFEEVD